MLHEILVLKHTVMSRVRLHFLCYLLFILFFISPFLINLRRWGIENKRGKMFSSTLYFLCTILGISDSFSSISALHLFFIWQPCRPLIALCWALPLRCPPFPSESQNSLASSSIVLFIYHQTTISSYVVCTSMPLFLSWKLVGTRRICGCFVNFTFWLFVQVRVPCLLFWLSCQNFLFSLR